MFPTPLDIVTFLYILSLRSSCHNCSEIFTTGVLHLCILLRVSYIILLLSVSQLVKIAHLVITGLRIERICWRSHGSQTIIGRTMGNALDAPQHPSGLPSAKWHDSHVGVPPGGHTYYSQA